MSSSPAPVRQPRRRQKSKGVFTNALIGFVLIVGGIYAVWGSGPLKRAWAELGFGKQGQNAGQSTGQHGGRIRRPSNASGAATDSHSRIPVPPLPLSQIGADGLGEQETQDPFLPKSRSPHKLRLSRPISLTPDQSDLELDQRFETDHQNLFDTDSDVVRTADFEEPAAESQSRPKPSRHRKIQFEVEAIETEVAPAEIPDVLQIGDQVKPGTKTGTQPATARPKKTGVPVKPASSVPSTASLKITEIQSLIEAGNDTEAYQLLAEAFTRYPASRPQFQDLLDGVAHRIYFTPQPQIEPPYEIEPGDQLRKIASKYHLSWQYLSRLNQVDAKKIRAGKKLKVFQGPFNATVDLSDFELIVYLHGKYVKRYQVGVGRDNSSPIGEFTVKDKLENPIYYGPEGNVLAADDPKNPLGERWIDIGNSFGIHGTIEPDSIGKSESAGCVRMQNEDVAEVYDLLTIGSTVIIQR